MNETPIPVSEEQRDQVKPTKTPTGEMDGNLNPLYNPEGTAEGGKDGADKKVVTQEGSHMKVSNPDKPDPNIKIDSMWTGKGEHIFNNKADTIKGQVIVNGDTQMVVKKVIPHTNRQEEKK